MQRVVPTLHFKWTLYCRTWLTNSKWTSYLNLSLHEGRSSGEWVPVCSQCSRSSLLFPLVLVLVDTLTLTHKKMREQNRYTTEALGHHPETLICAPSPWALTQSEREDEILGVLFESCWERRAMVEVRSDFPSTDFYELMTAAGVWCQSPWQESCDPCLNYSS